MILSDGLAIASYTRGVHQDGWIGRETTLHLLLYERFGGLVAALWIPQDHEPRSVLLATDDWVDSAEIRPGELSEYRIPCAPDDRGLSLRITIPEARSASPLDERVLGAVLHSIIGVPDA
jgi:hypothetical protein